MKIINNFLYFMFCLWYWMYGPITKLRRPTESIKLPSAFNLHQYMACAACQQFSWTGTLLLMLITFYNDLTWWCTLHSVIILKAAYTIASQWVDKIKC